MPDVTADRESSIHTENQREEPDMAEHKHGEMDITVQEQTFNGFIKFTTRTVIAIIIAVIFMALVNA